MDFRCCLTGGFGQSGELTTNDSLFPDEALSLVPVSVVFLAILPVAASETENRQLRFVDE